MFQSCKRHQVTICFAVLLLTVVGAYTGRDWIQNSIQFHLLHNGTRADWELRRLRQQLKPGGPSERDQSVRQQCLAIARENPGTRAELTALLFVARQWPDSPEGSSAFQNLLEVTKVLPLDDLALSLQDVRPGQSEQWSQLAAVLIDRVESAPDHPEAARLLSDAAVALKPDHGDSAAPEELVRIAQLIQRKYSTSPDLANFCEIVSNLGAPAAWSHTFEPHVRSIAASNRDRFASCAAHFALAAIVRSAGNGRQSEARQLYEDFLTKFDGRTKYPAQAVEQHYREQSFKALRQLQSQAIGMEAPETQGLDLSGRHLSLRDYRGRIVLVSFWATWCIPCMQAIPHERRLLEIFGPSEFAIFGMNADSDSARAEAAALQHGITWKSLRFTPDQGSGINNWTITGYPEFYLLDRDGVIVRWWTGLPDETVLQEAIRDALGPACESGGPPRASPTGSSRDNQTTIITSGVVGLLVRAMSAPPAANEMFSASHDETPRQTVTGSAS